MRIPSAVLIALIVAALCGCTTPSPQRTALPTTTLAPSAGHGGAAHGLTQPCAGNAGESIYAANGVRFEYPFCWKAVHYDEASSFSMSMVDLSSGPTHAPCTPISTPQETGEQCGWPITTLRPDGVLMRWTENGFAGWTLARQNGIPLRVAGLEARETISYPGSCGQVGASETLDIKVARSAPDNFYEAVVCLRGPDPAELHSTLNKVLSSVSFSQH